ncbi:deoxyribonuclease-1-like isoform X2 [Lytechinus pictus]|uniref:deoxyribonuclease-1-like isoform X2 n=1 Tax=Lytechinus pictus TaxID=7653 RepID=UPI0030BA15AE
MFKMDLSVILLTVLSFGIGSYTLKTTAQDFRVGAFSLKVFGQTKITDLSIVATIARVIMRYDIILLQGIIDSEGTAVDDLLKLVNSVESDDPYSMIISEGLGSSYTKEHYAYLYRSSRANLVRSYTYKDTGDRFEREPYIAIFESRYTAVSPFAVVGIKTTLEEINLLADVDSELEVKNVIFAGDFNANCGYVSNNRWKEVELRENPRYKWLIEDDVDTTPSDTDCAYRY